MTIRTCWCLFATAGLLMGCTALEPGELRPFYEREAEGTPLEADPVVFVPGLLGTTLVDRSTGGLVWGLGPDALEELPLPMAEGRFLDALRDDAQPDAVLGAAGEGEVHEALGVPAEGRAKAPFYVFPYDWRRDVVENARRLEVYLLELRETIGRPVRFDLVALSAGSLVTRWFLEYGGAEPPVEGEPPAPTWAGADLVDQAVLIGPPNAGATGALLALAEGMPRVPAAWIGTMPMVYQLLPRGRDGPLVEERGRELFDPLDPALWRRMRWGLAHPEADLAELLPGVADPEARRRIALDHLDKCLERARRVHAALDAPATPPPGLGLYLLGGDSSETPAVLGVDAATGDLRVLETARGDGTVCRSSMECPSRIAWRRVRFHPVQHVEFLSSREFVEDLLDLLDDPGSR